MLEAFCRMTLDNDGNTPSERKRVLKMDSVGTGWV